MSPRIAATATAASFDPPVLLPEDVLLVYKQARACFIELEEFDGENHEGGLLLFRDALEILVCASKAAPGSSAEDGYIAKAVDKLGCVATHDYEELATANLKAIERMHRRRPIRRLLRSYPGGLDVEAGIVDIRRGLRHSTNEYGRLTEKSRSASEWIQLSGALAMTYRDSVQLRKDLDQAPIRALKVATLVGAVISGALIALILSR